MKCQNGCGNEATKKCSRCNQASYCSSICQRSHWADHKKTCANSLPGHGAMHSASLSAPSTTTVRTISTPAGLVTTHTKMINLSDIPGFAELDDKFSNSVKSGHYSRAIRMCRKILALAKKSGLTKRHAFLAVVYANLGSCLGNEGDYVNAEKFFIKAITIADSENFDVVDGLISLYLNQNRLEDAEPLCKEYLKKSVQKYGKRDIGIVPSLRCNAILTKRQQRLDLAIEYLTRVYIILTDVNGSIHSDVQSVAHDLINALRMMGDLPTALYYAQLNYDNLANADNPASPPIAISDGAYILGTILGYVGTHKKSAEMFALSLDYREKELGPNALTVADTLEKLAFARIKQSDFSKEVLALLTRSLAIYKLVHGDAHSDCVRLEGLCSKIRSLHVSAT